MLLQAVAFVPPVNCLLENNSANEIGLSLTLA